VNARGTGPTRPDQGPDGAGAADAAVVAPSAQTAAATATAEASLDFGVLSINDPHVLSGE
jgi:hypothetical protein